MTAFYDSLFLACSAYIVGTATPGPATLLIATTSMQYGRRVGLATAIGVLCGSLTWGLLVAGGIASALSLWPPGVSLLRFTGGVYLLWLSFKSFRAYINNSPISITGEAPVKRAVGAFVKGLLVHLTNPKAVIAWTATVAIGSSSTTSPIAAFVVVAVCWCIGIVIFCGYAIGFASPTVTRFYLESQRKIDATAALLFAIAGLILLFQPF